MNQARPAFYLHRPISYVTCEDMSDTPKFEVIDRRKIKALEEQETGRAPEQHTTPEPQPSQTASASPPIEEGSRKAAAPEPAAPTEARQQPESAREEVELPAPPTAQESKEQKAAYDASAQRIEDMARAQNPAIGAQPPVSFEQLVQQLYVSGLIQMGAGAQEGQRPQIDILGARSTIDLLGILADKTRGNLTSTEDRMLQSALYELRMMFLEITGMISMPNVQPPAAPKR